MNIGIKLQFDFVVSPFILPSEDKISTKEEEMANTHYIMSPKFQQRNNT